MLNSQDITNLIKSINTNDIKRIKIETNKIKVVINKIDEKNCKNNKYITNKSKNNYYTNIQKIPPKIKNSLNRTIIEQEVVEHSTKYSTIISPMVGTFYRSPAPNEATFINIKDIVKPKQTVCIIEAMKLMNEIESEVQGEIVEILVNDGDIVDCGQALMKVRPL
uniref:Biotin carboxyl carrier protein of acetyl-CoA carboxylase n=1 Tax=Ophidocladus simpliciusculus TaxID=1261574 RepID=A0A1Z1MIZ3_9FLOR|nr:acetyl-CoA carboxylase biotin carboxyl carrier protein [Ophidocladus simpliciusculus]ARW66023.1 acetyl-CoA carboxylase biotin carboxyl carrier protein [Ophidocladus simpliciusculus]